MPVLTIIRGLPGSGKTTLAKKIQAGTPNTEHFEADQWMTGPGNIYKFDPHKLEYCHSMCQTETESALRSGKNVVVSNTFTTYREYSVYENIARRTNSEIQLIEVSSPWKNNKGIPEHALTAMKLRWEKLK